MADELPRLAAVQMVSGDSVPENLEAAGELVAKAAGAGASLVVLPENFAFLGRRETDKLEVAERDDGRGPMQRFLADAAREHGIWLVGGTIPLWGRSAERVRAACLVHGPDGSRVGRYDKIHLFDVTVSETESYRESNTLEPGEEPVVVDTDFGRLGLAICYDLRFPELFRELSQRDVDVIAVPSAFTAATGAAHWDVLVRARAVENLCYVVAADQGGKHPGGRSTHGESVVVDPWGRIAARAESGPGIAVAALDKTGMADIRRRFPALDHRRLGRASDGGKQ
ncbi:MAG: carbon-nitrogen hydrolase family protein [Ectothiorhodospiraceae bacterium]|jgi:nitrilase